MKYLKWLWKKYHILVKIFIWSTGTLLHKKEFPIFKLNINSLDEITNTIINPMSKRYGNEKQMKKEPDQKKHDSHHTICRGGIFT